jgi:hypothetical protein
VPAFLLSFSATLMDFFVSMTCVCICVSSVLCIESIKGLPFQIIGRPEEQHGFEKMREAWNLISVIAVDDKRVMAPDANLDCLSAARKSSSTFGRVSAHYNRASK